MNDKLISLVHSILDSDLPISTRDKIVRHYMLPELGRTKAIIQEEKVEVGAVERPSKEEVEIEGNPRLKAEYQDTERLMGGGDMEDEDEDE